MKHLRLAAPRQPAPTPHRPWRNYAREIFLAAFLALVFAWAVELVKRAPASPLPCEAARHYALQGAAPRCILAPPDLRA